MIKIRKFKIKNYKKKIKPILQMQNISKSYGQLNVLRDLNMNIMPGSITGLLGPNGCGKTTLFQCLLGIIKMDAGKLFINLDGKENVDIGSMPIHQRCSENQIKYIPQYDSLFRNLSIEENLRAVGEIFLKNRRELDEKIESLLSEFNLIENRKTLAINLSAGQKKKTQICRALIGNCRILIMDEPLSAVDPITISMIKDLIVRLALNKSITCIVSDHSFENVLQLADEIKILSDGHIISEGPPTTVMKDSSAIKHYFGTSY